MGGVWQHCTKTHGKRYTMDNKLKILKCLIENRAFSPSHAALAKELGYKGRMTVYRLIDGSVKGGTTNKMWDLIKLNYGLDDIGMYKLARMFCGFKHFYGTLVGEMNTSHNDWVKNLITSLVADAYEYCSPGFKAETAPVLIDLKADEPDVYWGMVALVYLHATKTDIYSEGAESASRRIITELDGLLYDLYPEKADAHDVAANLLSLAPAKNLCGLLNHCIVLFRNYAESGYRNEATKELCLFGFGKRSYWHKPGCPYGKGQDVWLLIEQSYGRMTNGFYLALRLKTGEDIQTFSLEDILCLEFYSVVDDEDIPILQVCRRRGTEREWCHYLYYYDQQARELRFSANPDTGNTLIMPETLRMISLDSPEDRDEKVWARIMKEWDECQGPAMFQKAKEMFSGITDMSDAYNIVDVSISKTALTLLIEHEVMTREYRLPIDEYDFLTEINPSQNIIIARFESDSLLYACWPELGYSIKLDEFTVG